MSEYQYYEFQALDRPLSEQEQAELRGLSRRVDLTPTRAVFTYAYGDFRGDPLAVLERHFDALLYVANWGSKRLAFRFPREAVDLERLNPYYYGVEEIGLTTTPEHVVLDIGFHEEGGGGRVEGEGLLAALVPLRRDILRGDLRAFYLAWLRSAAGADPTDDGVDDGLDDGEGAGSDLDAAVDGLLEPPVPAGLGQLSAPLRAFAGFFAIDEDLLAAAAEASLPLAAGDDRLDRSVALLPADERDAFLVRLARGEPHLDLALRRRLREVAGPAGDSAPSTAPRRAFAQLLAAAEDRKDRRTAGNAGRRLAPGGAGWRRSPRASRPRGRR